MNNAKELQAQYRQYRDSLYQEYPQAARFERSKRKLTQILLLLCLAVHLSGFCQTAAAAGAVTGYDALKSFTAMGTDMILLLAATGPRRRLAPALYLLSLYRLVYPGSANRFLPEMIAALSGTDWGQKPLTIAVTVCSLLYGLLVLATAIWLTLVPKNRKPAEQVEQIFLKLQQFTADHPVK